jgi:hypothetical protein
MKRLTCNGLAFFLFTLLLLPIQTPEAHASNPSVYESMSGTDGANMSGTASSDSVGLSGNWTVVTAFKKPDYSTSISPLYKNRFNSSLAFPANVRWKLPGSNTAASTAPEIYSLYYAQRQLNAGINFDSTGTFYFSFLDYVPNIGGSSGSAMIGLLNGLPVSSSDSASNSILMGRTYSNAPTIQLTPANNAAWNNNNIYSATGPVDSGTTFNGKSWFVVAKISTAATGNDTISLKFFSDTDTVPATDSAISWDVSYSGVITGTYNYLSVQVESDGTIDELRGGATYDAVSGVPIPPSVGSPTIGGTAYKGTSANLSITAGASGIFRFYMDGKRIPACLNVATTGSSPSYTATCSWKPPVVGNHRVYATFTSTDPGYTNLTTPTSSFTVLPRSGTR